MKKIVYLILILMASVLPKAQTAAEDQQSILGKWKMIKMDIKDGIYFDISDKDSSFKRFSKAISGNKDMPADVNSPWIKEAFEKAYEEFGQLFVEFKNDHTYISNQSGAEGILTIVSGTFSIDERAHTLTRFQNGQKASEDNYRSSGQLLTIWPKEAGKTASVIIFKKTE